MTLCQWKQREHAKLRRKVSSCLGIEPGNFLAARHKRSPRQNGRGAVCVSPVDGSGIQSAKVFVFEQRAKSQNHSKMMISPKYHITQTSSKHTKKICTFSAIKPRLHFKAISRGLSDTAYLFITTMFSLCMFRSLLVDVFGLHPNKA